MQNAKRKMQNEKNGSKPDRTKRTMLILAAAAFVLILLAGGLLWALLSTFSTENQAPGDLEAYLAGNWSVFRLRSWDPETGTLELDYPLRFSYEQMEKYGGRLEELQALPAGNLSTVEALKTAAFQAEGVTVREVTVYGLTTDGQIAYTVRPDGGIESCWEKESE